MNSPQSQRDLFRLVRQAGVYMAIPLVLVSGPTVGFFIGQFLDRRFDSDPWGVATLVLIGLVAGLVETVRLFELAQRISNDDR